MSEVLDDFCADGNFNRLDGGEQQSPKTFVKMRKVYNIVKATSCFELMGVTLNFKMLPITGKAEITYSVKSFYGFLDIIDKQTPLSENFNLPLCCYGLMCILPINKNVPLGTLILRERSGIC